MTGLKYKQYLLPILLGTLGFLLIVRILIQVFISDEAIFLPEDIDILVLVAILGVTMVVAINTIVRISIHYLGWFKVQQTRRETLAEHGRFLRRLDHELKNPLTTLRTGLSTLSLTHLDEQQQKIVTMMEAETLRLSGLVTGLRKLANLEAHALNSAPVNIKTLITDIIQVERDRFEAGERQLTGQIEGERPVWPLDADLLSLAIHNLLDNAFKYTHPADSIRVEVSAYDELIIRVIDTGIGILPEDLPHVWEELYRVEPKSSISGSGIGLSLVKTIVERHQGGVKIESTPGQGTRISLHFPALL